MSSLPERLAALSPEQRRLLEIRLKRQGIDASALETIPRRSERERAPLSFAQERLWFLEQLLPGTAAYNLPFAARLTGRLDLAALERSLNEVVRRHEALRTTFATVGGQPVQVVAPDGAARLEREDLRGVPAGRREAALRQRLAAVARAPFDLGRGPLWRAVLYRSGPEEHVALLVVHHLVADGWSLGVLVRELAALYAAFAAGRPAPLPEPDVQYPDFAAWQRQRLRGPELERLLAYWRGHLAAAPPALALPTDRPRRSAPTHRGARLPLALGTPLAGALRALGRREGATLFMTLLAAFAALLHRLGGQDDLVVGAGVANRTRAELEGAVGLFANTLALRADLSGDPPFGELLRRVRAAALGAFDHQDLPFEKLVEQLNPPRQLNRHPLVQVLFLWQNAPLQTLQLSGLTLSPLEVRTGATPFDLVLRLAEGPAGLEGWFDYDTDLFDRAGAARLARQYRLVLEDAAACPERRLSELPLLTPAERRRLLVGCNATRTERPGGCVHELFEAQTSRTPGAVAVVCGDEALSYAELDERANRLARHLRARGVGPEAVVGVHLERSPDLLVGLLGVLKAGGAYLPLDPALPPERVAALLADGGARLLVTQRGMLERLPAGRPPAVCLDADWEEIARAGAERTPGGAAPGHLAYVIYTSGSTGAPKGVMVTHRSVVNLLQAMRERLGLTERDRLLAVTPIGFDIAGLELFLPLSVGGRVALVGREAAVDGARLAEELERAEATVLQATPATWRLLLAAGWPGQAGLRLLCGGEALPPDLAAELLHRGAGLWNLYGPTETTIWSTAQRVEAAAGPVPIGRPIANTRVYLLDRRMEPVPPGVPAELYIGGAGVARGYLGRPELTAERFVPDPFGADAGQRLYRTGDLARRRSCGAIEFLGRTDDQVKIRGCRVEPGEVEAALRLHPTVRDAAVAAREERSGDARLVAYVVARPGAAPAPEELRRFLRARLPEYMLPAAFVRLDALPLTHSGKLDRRGLPPPDGGAAATAPYAAPESETESAVAAVWRQVLRLERVGRDDNFFDLGGHSLLATQVVARLRDLFGVELPLRSLFVAPTVAGLAEGVDEARRAPRASATPPVAPGRTAGPVPLSFAQEWLWRHEQAHPGTAAHNVAVAVRLTGRLDLAALERSLNEVVRRHEALRTTFAAADGRPVQVVAPASAVPLAVEDLPGRPAEPVGLQERLAAAARAPFDLARGPLLRAVLYRLGPAEHVALLVAHHIVADGWSLGVLLQEVAALYGGFAAGRPPPLPRVAVQYRDFASWQRERLRGPELERLLAYWRARLAGAPAGLALPTDRGRPPVPSHRGTRHPLAVAAPLVAALRALGQREGATLFMTLLAAWTALLHRMSGQEDLVVGAGVANRTRAELEGVVGLLANTLALRTDLSGDPSFRELLSRVREATLEAFDHQDLPFEKLVEELELQHRLDRHPLAQVLFVLHNTPTVQIELPSLSVRPIEVETGTARYDLLLSLRETGDRLIGALEYDTDLFDRATVAAMLEAYARLLEQLPVHPERRISELLPEAVVPAPGPSGTSASGAWS